MNLTVVNKTQLIAATSEVLVPWVVIAGRSSFAVPRDENASRRGSLRTYELLAGTAVDTAYLADRLG